MVRRNPGSWSLALLLALGAGLVGLANATDEQLRFRNYGVEDGLPVASLRSVFRDRQGFLWISSGAGLTRFDGTRFLTFRADAADPRSLSSSSVNRVLEDSRGRFWVATRGGGLNLFDRATRSARVVASTGAEGLPGEDVTELLEDRAGGLWVGMADAGVCALDDRQRAVECYRHEPDEPASLSSDVVIGMAQSGAGELWIATADAGLNRLDPQTGAITRFRAGDLTHPLPSDRLNSVSIDSAGELWIGTYSDGLIRLAPDGRVIRHYAYDEGDPDAIPSKSIKAVAEAPDGMIWIATWAGGILRLDPRTDRFTASRRNPDVRSSLSDDRVLHVLLDEQGLLWAATQDGLSMHDPSTRAFGLLRRQPGAAYSLADDKIESVLEDRDGFVWVGTYNRGLSRWDPRTGVIRNFAHDPADDRSLANNGIWALHEDAAGRLWIGTSRGLHHWQPDTETFVRHQRSQESSEPFSDNNVLSIASDPDGVLWLGTWNTGMDRYDPRTGEVRHYAPDPEDPEALPAPGVWSVVADREGAIWVATGAGLARLNPETDRFYRYRHDPADKRSLSSSDVHVLQLDEDGELWVGTDVGVDRRDAATGNFERITPADQSIAVLGLAVGRGRNGSQELWMATGRGLARMTVGLGELEWFDQADGLQGDQFTIGAFATGPSGRLYFGGPGGLTHLDPAAVTRNVTVPPIALTEFLLLNRPVAVGDDTPLATDVGHADRIVLDHTDYSFAFEFAALNLRQPEKNRYEYRLEGVDPEWVRADPDYPRITYTGVGPGAYRFQVRGSNDDGVWNQTGAEVAVVIQPPWWASTWFRFAAGVVLLLAAVAAVRWRLRALRSRNEWLARLVAERTAELQESNRKLETASLTDALTGLRNRRFLSQHLEPDLAQAERRRADPARGEAPEQKATHTAEAGADFIFILIDVDHFKAINDAHGHDAGDRILHAVAETLRAECRESDYLVRWGGEEFLVVSRFTSRAEAFATAERIRNAVEADRYPIGGDRTVPITCSAGVACHPFTPQETSALSWEQVVSLADQALYRAKRSGRNSTIEVRWTGQCPVSTLAERYATDFDGLVEAGCLALRMTD